jgi:hypothetical protein
MKGIELSHIPLHIPTSHSLLWDTAYQYPIVADPTHHREVECHLTAVKRGDDFQAMQ